MFWLIDLFSEQRKQNKLENLQKDTAEDSTGEENVFLKRLKEMNHTSFDLKENKMVSEVGVSVRHPWKVWNFSGHVQHKHVFTTTEDGLSLETSDEGCTGSVVYSCLFFLCL